MINNLKIYNIYEKVLDTLISDDNILNKKNLDKKTIKIIIINKMMDNFKKLLNDCSKETKEIIYEILCSNEDFYNSYILQGRSDSDFINKMEENKKVKVFLNSKESDKFIKDTFESYRGNKLLLITFFAQKKIEEKGFMEELEKNDYIPNKSIIPDIGNFFMLLFFSNKDMHNEKMKKIWYCLFEEFLVRQMFWIFHNGGQIVEILRKIKITKNENYILDIKKKLVTDKFENAYFSEADNSNLINYLKIYNIYEKSFRYFNFR